MNLCPLANVANSSSGLGNGILVYSQSLIHSDLVVSTKANFPFRFRNSNNRCSPVTGINFLDYPLFLESIQFFPHYIFESKWDWSWLEKLGGSICLYVQGSFVWLNRV